MATVGATAAGNPRRSIGCAARRLHMRTPEHSLHVDHDMRVIHGIEEARFAGVVLIIGNFDGVHRGHLALLEHGVELARRAGGELVIMTFEPHPAAILTPDRVPATLTPLDEKLCLLERAGASAAVVVRSEPGFFSISAEDFIREIIVGRFHPRACVEGENFRFGRHRQGDEAMLMSAGARHGFDVYVVPPVRAALGGHPDTVISSSLVRHLLASGNVDRAALCLGRPYALLGTVRHGLGRGRTLGFPTANVATEGQLVPAEGVYAGRAFVNVRGRQVEARGDRGSGFGVQGSGFRVQGSGNPQQREGERGSTEDAGAAARTDREPGVGMDGPFAAAVSIGRTPTFAENELLIEAHLLDFDGDLYGQTMRLELVDWIRDQRRFESVEALKAQIHEDLEAVRAAIPAPARGDRP